MKKYILLNEENKTYIILLEEKNQTIGIQFRSGTDYYYKIEDNRNIEEFKNECLTLGYKEMNKF